MEKELDWGNLSFGYIPTDYNVRCYYRDGKWGDIEVSQSETVNLHIAATALHYGQEIFEGLKAFREKTVKYAYSALKKMQNASLTAQKA
jgi:branched-chain amino acid aminotransferase